MDAALDVEEAWRISRIWEPLNVLICERLDLDGKKML